MDDVREGRPSFWNSGAVKSKVRDVIDGDLWVKVQKNAKFQRLRHMTFNSRFEYESCLYKMSFNTFDNWKFEKLRE